MDELVKDLRESAPKALAEADFDFVEGWLKEAADAIEELSRENESLAKSVNEASEILRKRWIPAEERLPDDGVYVLVRYKSNDMAVACVFDRDENFTFWRAQTDDGWCADCDTEPTHWMPLPEPPKEEK